MTHYFTKLATVTRDNWNKAALCNYKGESFSYGDIATRIEMFHVFFENAGIKKGDKIALCAKNSARWAISFLAANTYEAVIVPILSDFTPDSINHLVDHSEATMLFTDPDIWKKADITKMCRIKAVISVKDFTLLYSSSADVTSAFENLQDEFKKKYPMGFSSENIEYNIDNDKDIAIINYTSGTTSAPKGVMIRHECITASVEYAQKRVPASIDDSLVSMLPLAHMYGMAFEFIYPFLSGVTIYFFGKTPSPSLLLKAMAEIKPYLVVTVPLVMEKIYKSSIKPAISKWYMKILTVTPGISNIIYRKIGQRLQNAFGGNVKEFIMGGAALNPEVEKCFKKMKFPYMVGYGMTEASPLLGYEDWDKYVPGSCGKPVECCEVRIDSEDPQHIAGEIQARGTNICSGYFKNPEASANAFTEDGFLRTGDLGIMDSKNNIFIKGRSKSMILTANGQNIYPEEVEAVINSCDFVAESVVVDRASKIVALVYLDEIAIKKAGLDDESIADIPENVRTNANRQLPGYSKITKVEVVLTPFEKTPKMSIKRFLYK